MTKKELEKMVGDLQFQVAVERGSSNRARSELAESEAELDELQKKVAKLGTLNDVFKLVIDSE